MMRTASSAVVPARCNRPSTSSSLPSEQRHRPAVLGTCATVRRPQIRYWRRWRRRQAVSRMVPPSAKRTAPVATTRMNSSGESGHRAGCHADRTRDGDGLPPVPRWRGYCIRRAARCRTACRSTWRAHPTPDCNDSVREWQPRPSGAPETSLPLPALLVEPQPTPPPLPEVVPAAACGAAEGAVPGAKNLRTPAPPSRPPEVLSRRREPALQVPTRA